MSFLYSGGLFDVIPDSGVSRWTFDDANTDSGIAIDVWNGNDGTINGATTGVSGANQTYTTNEAYDFDGADDDVTTTANPTLNDWTISFWARSDDPSPLQMPVGAYDNIGLFIGVEDGNISMEGRVNPGGTFYSVEGTTALSTGAWYHIVGRRSGSDWSVWVDGQLENEESKIGDQLNSSEYPNWMIGDFNKGGYEFDGKLDDVRLYDKALSSSEISDLYNNGSI